MEEEEKEPEEESEDGKTLTPSYTDNELPPTEPYIQHHSYQTHDPTILPQSE